MSAISPRLARVIREVGKPSSPAHLNLRPVIEQSTVLMQQMEAAVVQGHLKHFALMPATENAGASYSPDTQTINLKPAYIGSMQRSDARPTIEAINWPPRWSWLRAAMG